MTAVPHVDPSASAPDPGTQGSDSPAWWHHAVVYQVYPRSFADGNGDGRGDLWGLIERLDHLEALGVDAVWMSPCYPSPQHDHGYDVSDYFDINPDYGDLAVFDELVAAAARRNIRIMLDVVPNHCSIEHAWFRGAVAAGPGSAERERFYFRDGRGTDGGQPPNNWVSVFGGPAWSRITEPDGTPGQWYLHVFDSSQPDFNWENEDVADHFDRMLTFWFDRGVEGFRVDAVTVVGKTPGLPDTDEPPPGIRATEMAVLNRHFIMKPRAHDYWRRWRRLIDRYETEHEGRRLVTISEAYTPRRPDILARFVRPDQFHQSFAFDLMLAPWIPSVTRSVVGETIAALDQVGARLSWTLNNHDTQRAVTRYGRADAADTASWTGNNLVYTDTAVDLALGARRARAMVGFAAALPGALYIYQGEELGLPEWLDLPDESRQDPIHRRTGGTERGRDGCRVPLPWSSDPATNFGFSRVQSTGHRAPAPWLPQPSWWGQYAADAQHARADSMLAMYRRLMACRRQLDHGAPLTWVLHDHPQLGDAVAAFRRGNTLVVMNMADHGVTLPESLTAGMHLVFTSAPDQGAPTDRRKASNADMGPNTTVWYQR